MSEQVKFSDEELNSIKEIQNKYIDIQNAFGQVSLSRLKIQEQIKILDEQDNENEKKFKAIQKDEADFLDKITKKYGEGTLNPESGVFIPNK